MPFASSNPANKSIDKKLKETVNQHEIYLVKNLVEEVANPFIKNKDGKIAKMIAAEIESSTFGNGSDEAKLKISQEKKYFFQLAKTNKWHEIEELVTKKPYLIYEQDNNGDTALSLAVKLGNLEITRLLIANGANINTVDNNGNTLVHIAAINAHLELISELLNKGLIIDDKNHIGDTPLESATRIKENLKTVKALIEDKPSLYKEYPNLNKIYNLAYQAETSLATKIGLASSPMCKYIKQIKNETNNFIQLVTENKIEQIKEKIILKPYLIISNDKNNNTALHIAASKNYLEISEILVKYGIDIEAKNINYKTALDVAIESDRSWAGYFTNNAYNASTIMVNTSTYPVRNIANKVAERVNKIIGSTNKSDLAKIDFTKNSYISTKETRSYLQSLTNHITAKSEIEGNKRLKNAQKEATIPSQDLKKLKTNSSATNLNLTNKQKDNKLSK